MCTWLNKFFLRKDVYYYDRNHYIVLFDYCLLLPTDWLSDISQKAYCKFTGLGRKNLCLDLHKLDNMRRTYDMVTISKNQKVSSIYIGAGGS